MQTIAQLLESRESSLPTMLLDLTLDTTWRPQYYFPSDVALEEFMWTEQCGYCHQKAQGYGISNSRHNQLGLTVDAESLGRLLSNFPILQCRDGDPKALN